jgi:AcrR family transcriptional regulator
MIARAASEVGLDKLTMKAVAEHLGVSVAGLYHHVQGREELVRLGAEFSAAQIPVPVDHGQHWTVWLLEWANYVYDAFVAQPALLGQFLNGSISIERMAPHMDAVLGVLTRQGFNPMDAIEAYGLVSDCALGAAVTQIREIEAARAGRQLSTQYSRMLAHEPSDALPNLRKITRTTVSTKTDVTDRILTLLVGIAARRGEAWKPILDLRQSASGQTPNASLLHP